MAFTADAIIANIESRLGDSGRHVWSYYGLASGAPWCVGEVSYTFNKTGNKTQIFGGRAIFYVPTAQIWLAKNYRTIYDYRTGGSLESVRKGDIIIFMWTRGSRDHIGFARASGTGDALYTIEGNTSGGKVARRTRAKANIYAVYRPPYSASTPKPTKPAQSKKQTPSYRTGTTYTVQVNDLNVRTGPGSNYARKTKAQLTPDGRKHADAEGQLKKGTRVTCQGQKANGKEIWIKIPSGWICAWTGSKKYVR